MAKPQVVFFGSGPVAARSLELLVDHCSIEAVVTKPRAAHHKGAVPVLDVAQALNLPVQTVSTKQELDDLIKTKPFKSELGVLIDFGIIVSQKVIDYFPYGIVNSHFSILPEWRGADPITFAVLSGQKQTGVSLMLLVEKMDEGPLISYGKFDLPSDITTPLLTEHLIRLSDMMLRGELPRYLATKKSESQDVTGRKVSYSRKLTKDDSILDWDKPAAVLEREIRAFIGWPGSRTQLAGKDVTITKAHVVQTQGKPGKTELKDKELLIYCKEDALAIDMLKPAGKHEMPATAFVAGHKHLL